MFPYIQKLFIFVFFVKLFIRENYIFSNVYVGSRIKTEIVTSFSFFDSRMGQIAAVPYFGNLGNVFAQNLFVEELSPILECPKMEI